MINIFGKNLFEDKDLLTYFEELIGYREVKPFECVGTVEEVNYSLQQILGNYNNNLPFLLNHYTKLYLKLDLDVNSIIHLDDKHHHLDNQFVKVLEDVMK